MIAVEKLKKWIATNIETEGFTRFEDLHVDELAIGYSTQDIAKIVNEFRSEIPTGFCVSIGVSLDASDSPLGITFHSASELSSEFTVTPPSVYVFKKGDEPWTKRPSDAERLPLDLLSVSSANVQLIYFEYQEMNESEYRRSLWFVC